MKKKGFGRSARSFVHWEDDEPNAMSIAVSTTNGDNREADFRSRLARMGATMPTHVAIIMDGNGRWAKQRGLPRIEGHRCGVEAVRRTVRAARQIGLRYLTIYSFSTENWSRPVDEVMGLMGLLRIFIRGDLADLKANNVRIKIIGERRGVPNDISPLLCEAESVTENNTGLTLLVAFNYGGRQEILSAARALAEDARAGRLSPESIDDDIFSQRLTTAGAPDPDLVIRTSGEQRVSNFLLWQAAYAEYVFSPLLWPDFDGAALEAAILDYCQRERRFGGVDDSAKRSAS